MANKTVSFKKGKEPRTQLELPTLHFVVMDQWVDVIGDKALLAWLKMYTWCDRSNNVDGDVNLWEQANIPMSLNQVMKKLKVGKDTLYNQILKPLWNVGLIDFEEYEDSKNTGNKPLNIIVYKYPQNDKKLSYVEIELVRDYDKDYHSKARTFAKKGGRPKSKPTNKKEGGSEREPGVVLNENQGWFQSRTGGSSDSEPRNNIFNNINNNLNTNTNNLNNNLSIKEEIKTLNIDTELKSVLEKQIDRLIHFKIDLSDIVLHSNATKDMYGTKPYAYVLDALLSNLKEAPNNFGAVMDNWLERNKQKQNVVIGPTKTEIVPDWLNEQKQGVKNGQAENEKDFLLKREELQAKLKQKYSKG